MKFKFIIPLIAIVASLFVACEDASTNLGIEIQPVSDGILLDAATFTLNTETFPVARIVSKPDSLLLGKYIDDFLGTSYADIITQLRLPTTEFRYMDPSVATTVADSVVLHLGFSSYFGVNTAPIEVSVYELKKALSDSETYYSDIDPAEYVDFSKKLNAMPELLTIKDGVSGKIQKSLDIKLSDEFLSRFFTTDPTIFSGQEAFQNFFKGLYVTTDFGSSAMINVNSLSLTLYYHYTLNDDPTKAKIKGYHDFHANTEIVKVNRIQYYLSGTLKINPEDEFNYIVSPSTYQTKVRIPMDSIRRCIDASLGDKVLDVNSTILKLNVQDRKVWGANSIIPYVESMLLIKEDAVDEFFKERQLPSDTVAFLADLDKENITSTTFTYHYTFYDLASLIEHELKKDSKQEFLDMVLIPVRVTRVASGSSSQMIISEINPATQMQAVSIFSGKNKENPMRLEIVFSGY